MQANLLSRRRFIGIAGAAAGMALFPEVGEARVHHWKGVVMGARATIQLVHSDATEAQRVIRLALREIERLESIFSLYRPDSAVSRLNRDGYLTAPPLELVDLFTRAAAVSALSDGAFDMTIQPLWARYRDHFIADPGAPTLPPVDDILPLIDWRAVEIRGEAINFGRIGMAVTPNGIAQGYITDCVADLLRRNGIERVALNLGEVRTIGRRADGNEWVVGIMDPGDRERIAGRIVPLDRAVATSGGYGTIFDSAKRYSHLLDPRTGKTAPIGRGVTVIAAEACFADACSTALALKSSSEIRDLMRCLGDIDVYIAATDSGLERLV